MVCYIQSIQEFPPSDEVQNLLNCVHKMEPISICGLKTTCQDVHKHLLCASNQVGDPFHNHTNKVVKKLQIKLIF